jgi:hypothetical protein
VLLFFSLGGFGEISPKLEECFTGRNLLTRSFEARPYFMHRGGPATHPAREHVAPVTLASSGRSGDWRGAVIGACFSRGSTSLEKSYRPGWFMENADETLLDRAEDRADLWTNFWLGCNHCAKLIRLSILGQMAFSSQTSRSYTKVLFLLHQRDIDSNQGQGLNAFIALAILPEAFLGVQLIRRQKLKAKSTAT